MNEPSGSNERVAPRYSEQADAAVQTDFYLDLDQKTDSEIAKLVTQTDSEKVGLVSLTDSETIGLVSQTDSKKAGLVTQTDSEATDVMSLVFEEDEMFKTPITAQPQAETDGHLRPSSSEVDPVQLESDTSCTLLNYFTHLDELRIIKIMGLLQVCSPTRSRHRYIVTNKFGQEVFFAFEEPFLCNISNVFCGVYRGYTFHVENNENDAILIRRPFKCCTGQPCCCEGSCPYPSHVFDGKGNCLGYMTQTRCCSTRYNLWDVDKQPIYRIECPCLRWHLLVCRTTINFPVTRIEDGNEVGNIAQCWRGMTNKYGDGNYYIVKFERMLRKEHKALVFAAAFMMDMMLYCMG